MDPVLVNAAMEYCNIKMLVSGVIMIIVAIASSISAIMMQSDSADTSNYTQTSASVKETRISPVVHDKSLQFNVIAALEYTVNGKSYTASSTNTFNSDYEANNFAKNYKTDVLFYNPKSPEQNVSSKGQEDNASMILIGIAIVMFISAVLGILFRRNKIFCGLQVLGDTKDVIFGRN